MPAIVVRVVAFSYSEQLAWVRWGRSCCRTFRISNSTRQGSVASPAFWNIYLDPLFSVLREAGVGCHMAGMFLGVVGYADDLILLAPSQHAAQMMLKSCKQFCSARAGLLRGGRGGDKETAKTDFIFSDNYIFVVFFNNSLCPISEL